MLLDEILIKNAKRDFRQEGECAATRLAVASSNAGGSPRSMFLTEVCERFEKEIAELRGELTRKTWIGCCVMARRHFQL